MDLPAPTVCILFFAHFLLKSPWRGLLLCFQRTMILLWVITQAPQNSTSLTPVVNAQRRLAWIFRPRRSSESRTKECSNMNPKEGWSDQQLHVDGVVVRGWPVGLALDEMLWPGSQTAFRMVRIVVPVYLWEAGLRGCCCGLKGPNTVKLMCR